MAVTVTYGGDPVPKSPFVVNVAPPLDLSKVKVQGLNSSKWGRSRPGREKCCGVGRSLCSLCPLTSLQRWLWGKNRPSL